MTFQAIQAMDNFQVSPPSLSKEEEEQQEINSILDRINNGEEVSEYEYNRVERAVLAEK